MTAIETFFGAWSMTDPEQRTAAIAQAAADGVWYADPQAPDPMSGIEALSTYVGMFSENAPGWSAKVVASDETAGMVRATVAFGGPGPDGSEMAQHGQYFVELDGDKIKRMVGFVGTGQPD
jgi:hypothetical protein